MTRKHFAVTFATVAAAALAGCLAPAAEPSPPEPGVMATLGGTVEVEGSWSSGSAATAAEGLGYNVTVQTPERIATTAVGGISIYARATDASHWQVDATRTYWRVDVCSTQELDAWANETWMAIQADVEAALRTYLAEFPADAPSEVSRIMTPRHTDGTLLRLPETCPSSAGVIRIASPSP